MSRRPPQHDKRETVMDWLEAADSRENRNERASILIHEVLERSGLAKSDAALGAVLIDSLLAWLTNPDVMHVRSAETAEGSQEAVEQAMTLASEAEQRAVAAEQALAKATEREEQARADCKAALDRAKAAEAERDRLDAALRPLRALLTA